jgi:DNA-binding response OmpR family regulator
VILVVEDEPANARALSRVFTAAGYCVNFASSCAAARTTSGPFDVAVLDIDLGDGDGVSLARELLAANKVRRVIFHTATLDKTRHAQASQIGPVLPKSGDAQALLAALRARLDEPGR